MTGEKKSIGALLGDAMQQLGKLIQNEIQLARAETMQKVSLAASGIALMAGAGIMMIAVLVVVMIAIAMWFTQLGLSPVGAYFAAAAIGALIAAVLVLLGLSRLKPQNLTPNVTLQQVGRDIRAVKELVK